MSLSFWKHKAVEQGNAGAQHNLGSCYEYGNGTEKNKEETYKWYKKAAEQGHAGAKEKLDNW